MNLEEKSKKIAEIYPEFADLAKQIVRSNEGSVGYENWIKDHEAYKLKTGLLWSTVKAHRTALKKCVQRSDGYPQKVSPAQLTSWIEKVDELIPVLDEYVQRRIHNQENDEGFTSYFIHFLTKDTFGKHPEVEIRRMVLIKNANNSAKLVTGFGNSLKDFPRNGKYTYSFKSQSTQYYFSNHQDQKEISQGFYFLVKEYLEKRSLLYGSYVAFDPERIYSGPIILEEIKGNTYLEEGIEHSLSLESPGTWYAIRPQIVDYLTQISQSFSQVVNRGNNLDDLNDYLYSSNHTEKLDDRFFGPYPYGQVYLCIPSSLAEKMAPEDYSKRGWFNSHSFHNVNCFINVLKERSYDDPVDSIKRSKAFILFLGLNDIKDARALVELGLALTYCKYILVWVSKDLLDEIKYYLQKLGGNRVDLRTYNDFEESAELIIQDTRNYIKNKFKGML